MATTVTVKGQVTIPKAVRDAVGIKPGDRVEMRALPEGGVVIERASAGAPSHEAAVEAAKRRVDAAIAMLDRRGVEFSMSTDEWMRMLRDDD